MSYRLDFYIHHFRQGALLSAVCLSVCVSVCEIDKASMDFHEIWGIGKLWTQDELIKYEKVGVRIGALAWYATVCYHTLIVYQRSCIWST